MALITSKVPSIQKWLFNNNNHILEFYSDDETTTSDYAEILIDGIDLPIIIYPNIDGLFWFNFNNYFSVLLYDIEDDIDSTNLDVADINTFIFEWSKVVAKPLITYKIFFTNGLSVQDSFTPYVINGSESYLEYKRGLNKDNAKVHLLSTLTTTSANRYYLKYWEGYPFDFGLTQVIPNVVSPQTISNNTVGDTTPQITMPYACQRVVVCNGDTDTSIENHLPLIIGKNEIVLYESPTSNIYLDLHKEDTKCGVYLKWFNKSGGYNYWLFNDMHLEEVSTRAKGSIKNDSRELADTVSPMLSLGRTSEESWLLKAEHLTLEDVNIIQGLFDSTAIFLFTGERFSASGVNDWLEVEISNTTFQKRDWKGRVPELIFSIEIPRTLNINR